MILLRDIVEVLQLAQRNGQAAVGSNADNGSRVGVAPTPTETAKSSGQRKAMQNRSWRMRHFLSGD